MKNIINEDINSLVKIEEEAFKKEQEELIKKFYERLWIANNKQYIWTDHFHVCQFELEQKLFHSKDKNWAKLKCKEHLKSFGSKRDKSFWCCDAGENGKPCRYMKTFVKDSNGEILFVN